MDKLTNWLSDELTYGFGSLTQDEFCSAVLILLGVIAFCQVGKLFFAFMAPGKNSKQNQDPKF